jgi:hypothetical protein
MDAHYFFLSLLLLLPLRWSLAMFPRPFSELGSNDLSSSASGAAGTIGTCHLAQHTLVILSCHLILKGLLRTDQFPYVIYKTNWKDSGLWM